MTMQRTATMFAPERVLDAGRDFSERRADVWPNVTFKHLEVHERGETFADVTEGTWVVGFLGALPLRLVASGLGQGNGDRLQRV